MGCDTDGGRTSASRIAVPSSDRHLDPENLDDYLAVGVPAIVPIEGDPPLWLIIDPTKARIAIRAFLDIAGEIPNLEQYKYLQAITGTDSNGHWVEFAAYGRSTIRQAYPLLVAVADRVQLNNDPFGTAIERVISAFRDLLSSLSRLSEIGEVGLYGELVVLDHLVGSIGEYAAVTSWKGPKFEEHDFGLSNLDIEVKTTTSEERRHMISSLTQLEASANRALWLVSIQLTTGGAAGTTLSTMVDNISERLINLEVKAQYFDKLRHNGWRKEESHLYQRIFNIRSQLKAYMITSTFPAITSTLFEGANFPIERITSLSYGLTLTGLANDQPPIELQGLTAT